MEVERGVAPAETTRVVQTAMSPTGLPTRTAVAASKVGARPATNGEEAPSPKRRRVRRKWDPCTRCESKHGMRFGVIVNKEFQFLACDKCKTADMKDLSRVCKCSGKDLRYGYPGGPATRCYACREPAMVNLRPSSGLCDCGSTKVRRYGVPGGARTNCLDCKTPAMVNLSLSTKAAATATTAAASTTARGEDARAAPRATPPPPPRPPADDDDADDDEAAAALGGRRGGDTPASARSETTARATQGAWGGRCACGSGKVKRFGAPGGKRTHCIDCRADGMVNLTQRLCACGSERQIRYGAPDGSRATHCSLCKRADMIDLTKRSRRLCACGSEKQLRYGPVGGVATKCSKCRDKDMVDLTKKRAPGASGAASDNLARSPGSDAGEASAATTRRPRDADADDARPAAAAPAAAPLDGRGRRAPSPPRVDDEEVRDDDEDGDHGSVVDDLPVVMSSSVVLGV